MDFRYHFSDEQEQFRRDVRSWIVANLTGEFASPPPQTTAGPNDSGNTTSILALLAQHGCLTPFDAPEAASGGLNGDLAVVLMQELERHGLLWLARETSGLLRMIRDFGTADQHGTFLSAIALGKLVCWTPAQSSDGAVDPSKAQVQAMRDGDDYILDGMDQFLGLGANPDYLWVQAVSGPEGPSPTVSVFLVPANSEGVSVFTTRRLTSRHQHRVSFDHVRVPSNCLLGNEGDGWVLSSLLRSPEMEPLPPLENDRRVIQLLEYASRTAHEGESLSSEPTRQQLLMEAWIDSRLASLFRTRDAWMKDTGQELTYHVAQTRQWERRSSQRLAEISRAVAGMYALLDSDDPRAPSQGGFEYLQRLAVADDPPESAVAGDVAIIANALGLAGSLSQDRDSGQMPSPPELSAPVR